MPFPGINSYSQIFYLAPGNRPFKRPDLDEINEGTLMLPPYAANPTVRHWGAGSYAAIFRIQKKSQGTSAVRTLLRAPDPDIAERSLKFQQHVAQHPRSRSYLVESRYVLDGVTIGVEKYPIFLMEWVEGKTLYDYVQALTQVPNHSALRQLVQQWIELVSCLQEDQIAHGDLQHNNIMVTTAGELRLIDYDTIFVPALAGRSAFGGSPGTEGYCHPAYLTTLKPRYDALRDTFSALVILVSLYALALKPEYWRKNSQDNLLFKGEDLAHPDKSPLFQCLLASQADKYLRTMAGCLYDCCLQKDDCQLHTFSSLVPLGIRADIPYGFEAVIERKAMPTTPVEVPYNPGSTLVSCPTSTQPPLVPYVPGESFSKS